MAYLRVTEDDGSQWVNAEAFDEVLAALRTARSALTNGGSMLIQGTFLITIIDAAIAKAEAA